MFSKFIYHLHTCFLFTKSDIKTTVIPITALACAATDFSLSTTPISHIIGTVFWVWLHVLQFDVSNQTLDVTEDAVNKPDRPLPANRISMETALWIRVLLVPLCLLWSSVYSTQLLMTSALLCILTFTYNELRLQRHWVLRNVNNAFGFASFEMGACLVCGMDRSHLGGPSLKVIAISTGIFMTSIQAQDFKDVGGDEAVGRKTLAILYPALSRWTMGPILLIWSVLSVWTWHVSYLLAWTITCVAALVGGRFVTLQSRDADQMTFYIYNVWLTIAHVMPAFRDHFT